MSWVEFEALNVHRKGWYSGYTIEQLEEEIVEKNLIQQDLFQILIEGVIFQKCEMIRCAISHGVDLNTKHATAGVISWIEGIHISISEGTALHLATHQKAYNIMELLINVGADLNVRDDLNRTPLMIALLKQSCESAIMLIEKGCDVEIIDSKGTNAFYYSVFNYTTKHLAIRLLTKGNVNYVLPDKRPLTPLKMAIFHIDTELVKKCLEYGADIEHYNDIDGSPFTFAMTFHNKTIVQLLIDYGCNIEVSAENGNGGIGMLCSGPQLDMYYTSTKGKILEMILQVNSECRIANWDSSYWVTPSLAKYHEPIKQLDD